ncbi:MAG: LamB/YcsF family protein, partial [Acidimicrobiales bacterium]|nr:LamB/YcsF family protein [Acidimicrobiales bacterium]
MPPTSPGPSVDLNADVGEGAGGDSAAGAHGAAGGDRAAGDEVLLDLVTSASVACGVHGGDPGTMRRTVEAAARRGVVVGAHPSYPDREGFGRRPMDIAPAQVTTEVRHQVEALDSLARRCGTRVRYVKPHGALYHRMADDEECALAVADALRQVGDLVLLAPAGSRTLGLVASTGVRIATEAFADRAYRPDGRLAPRGAAGVGAHRPRGGGPAGGRHRGGPPGACRGRDHDRPGRVVDLRARRHSGRRHVGAASPRGARERRGDPAPLRDVSPHGAVRDVRPFGDGALVAEVASAADAHGLAGTVSDAGWHGVEDVVVGYRSVTVVTDPAAVDIAAMGDELARIPAATPDRGARRRFEIPVAFDGPDLDDVTAVTGMSRDDVVEQLLDTDLEVAFVGFLPGFAYLEGLPRALAAVPSRATPRSAVAAGSVGIGGGFAGVYPQASPGGWQVLGRTGFELFDPGTPPFAVLRPGDGIRFREARDPGVVMPRARAP